MKKNWELFAHGRQKVKTPTKREERATPVERERGGGLEQTRRLQQTQRERRCYKDEITEMNADDYM
jgi:hypothetical protein